MNDKRLTVLFGGREALPVRAIPYVAPWARFSPDVVITYLTKGKRNLPRDLTLSAYHLNGADPVRVELREWDGPLAKLKGFEAELDRKYANRDENYAAWRRKAVKEILPASVFMWLDEFEKEFQDDQKGIVFNDERLDNAKLILTPMLDADTREMVMEGFEGQEPGQVTQAATGGAPKVKTGRPPSVQVKAEIVRQIVVAFETAANRKFDSDVLPGSAADLLDACMRIEKAVTKRNATMVTTTNTFKKWLRAAGYSFSNGCTPKDQATFWTHLTPQTITIINAGVFTGVSPEKSP